jgi:NAD-dependent deacetylase
MKTILCGQDETHLAEAVQRFREADYPLALTGAGISVPSGIADFRSPGGLWSRFSPDEYATLTAFRRTPQKAWSLYREMGLELIGKQPNKAHLALAQLEQRGLLTGVITQNVDNLHQQAGSSNVVELHGDHQHLQCLQCGDVIAVTPAHYHAEHIPECPLCRYPYKPNVVLFEEAVRHLDRVERLVGRCDLLLVIGTSAQVYPAAGFPHAVRQNGGLLYEFNLEPALGATCRAGAHFFFSGNLIHSLPHFSAACI